MSGPDLQQTGPPPADGGPRRRGGSAAFAMRHSRALVLTILGMCAWGVAALYSLPSGIYPNVAFPRITVIAERGEDSPQNMMVAVTRPFEQAVSAVQGLTRLRTKTTRGAVEMSLDFDPSTDMREALSQTRARVQAAAAGISPPVDLTIERQTPSIFPVISFDVALDRGVKGSTIHDGADLLDWANFELKPRVSRLPYVFMVTAQGADQRQIVVEADPAKLATSGLTLDDLATAIEEANQVTAVGIMEKDYRQYQILASSQVLQPAALVSLPLLTRGGQTIHLSDVAAVRAGTADRTAVVTGDGQDAIVMSVFMRYGGKITDLSKNLTTLLDTEITPALPKGVHLTPVYDQADLVNEFIGGVRDAILIGTLLTVIVLWLFLASWRLTLVAAISIPISLLGTFALMTVTGQSLNMMSLGGIAVAIGLIIDNAIVVVENIARRVRGGLGRRAAIIDATREIFGAVVGSSFTTVVVFLPLVKLEGVVGQFFIALAVGLSLGILVSMVVSLTLSPLMAAGRLGPRPEERTSRAWTEWLARQYKSVAAGMLRWPKLTSLVIFLILGVGAYFAIHQQTGFLPQMDEGTFVLDYTMPVGTSLGETDKNCRKIEAILRDSPDIAHFSRRTGMQLGIFTTEQFTGDFLVGLKPPGKRRSVFDVIDDLDQRIHREVPQIDVEFVQLMQDNLNDLAGAAAPITVRVFGPDYRVLQNIVDKLADVMGKSSRLTDITPGQAFGNPEMTYHIDVDAAARVGLTPADVSRQLETALVGRDVTELRQGERLVPVHLRYPDSVRRDPTWLMDLPLFVGTGGSGRIIPAALVTRLDERDDVNELNRENQQGYVEVNASLASGVDLGSAAAAVRALVKQADLPVDVHAVLGGQVATKALADANMRVVLALACALVFLLLVIQFHSYRLPFIIFLTLPPSQIGALLALRLTGTHLDISAEMGLVMLVGLVVKNGIIFIEYAAQLREAGMPTLSEALLEAGRVRLRPILMTSLAAIIAMVPLVFSTGAGAELQKPLAIAVIGGLSVSTFFTVFIIPVAHLLLGEPKRMHLKEATE